MADSTKKIDPKRFRRDGEGRGWDAIDAIYGPNLRDKPPSPRANDPIDEFLIGQGPKKDHPAYEPQPVPKKTPFPKRVQTTLNLHNVPVQERTIFSLWMKKPEFWMAGHPEGVFVAYARKAGEATHFRGPKEDVMEIKELAFIQAVQEWGGYTQVRDIKVHTYECPEGVEGRVWATRAGVPVYE